MNMLSIKFIFLFYYRNYILLLTLLSLLRVCHKRSARQMTKYGRMSENVTKLTKNITEYEIIKNALQKNSLRCFYLDLVI